MVELSKSMPWLHTAVKKNRLKLLIGTSFISQKKRRHLTPTKIETKFSGQENKPSLPSLRCLWSLVVARVPLWSLFNEYHIDLLFMSFFQYFSNFVLGMRTILNKEDFKMTLESKC